MRAIVMTVSPAYNVRQNGTNAALTHALEGDSVLMTFCLIRVSATMVTRAKTARLE